LSRCHQEQIEAREQHQPTAYVPECTDNGEFSPKQCHTAIRQCWCVYTSGREVPGTRRTNSQRLFCQKVYDPSEYEHASDVTYDPSEYQHASDVTYDPSEYQHACDVTYDPSEYQHASDVTYAYLGPV